MSGSRDHRSLSRALNLRVSQCDEQHPVCGVGQRQTRLFSLDPGLMRVQSNAPGCSKHATTNRGLTSATTQASSERDAKTFQRRSAPHGIVGIFRLCLQTLSSLAIYSKELLSLHA